MLHIEEIGMKEYDRPLPEITASLKPFWDGAKRNDLMIYKCLNCGAYYFPVTDCMHCNKPKMEWVKAGGKGKIYTFVIYHTAYNEKWKDLIPYNVAWIELDEGPIMISNVVGCKNEDLYINMPVKAVFEEVNGEITLPKFSRIE
jgi:uncharacterized protein